MNRINHDAVAIHEINYIKGVDVLTTSAKLDSKNIYVYTSRVRPFKANFSAVPSLLVGMTIGGFVRGHCSIGASLAPLDLAPGTIFFIPPNTPFEAQVESSAEIINVYISEQLFKNIEKEFLRVSENLLSLSFRFSVSDSFLSQTMLSIKEIVERGGTFARIELEYFVRVLTARLIVKYSKRCPAEHVGESGLPPNVLHHTLAYIDQNLHRRLTTHDLSTMAGLGSAQFARLFKRSANITLHQYIILRRIERARILLEETRLPVVEIAQECGFADQVHLTRFFSRLVGTSPASFRRKAQSRLPAKARSS